MINATAHAEGITRARQVRRRVISRMGGAISSQEMSLDVITGIGHSLHKIALESERHAFGRLVDQVAFAGEPLRTPMTEDRQGVGRSR